MKNNINYFSTLGMVRDEINPYNNRAKLDTGTQCNYGCSFCYYQDKLEEVTPIEVIKERVDYLVSCGITEVDLSGGESSIHKNWFEILHYCTSNNLNISTLSNGSRFCDETFIRDSFNHGLKEILFSVHGYDEESHDRIVGRQGAFKKMVTAIKNANRLGMIVRVNCTITNDNYTHLNTKYVDLIKELKPEQLNFLTLNYWSTASGLETFSYSESTPQIKSAIDQLNGIVPEIVVRYTPYCYMKGYEKYVCGVYQHIHDVKDWNIALYHYDIKPSDYIKTPLEYLYKRAQGNRVHTYYKKEECKRCRFYKICDGVEKHIKDIELFPEEGDIITDISYYRE
jgi:MoaA/NifB/PqqE/SkfB family radical SAM enzyme